MDDAKVERCARRLVRLYPRQWRQRFGDEFEQLLIDELSARRRSPRRAADVVAHALLAHLTAAGLTGRELAPRVQAWRAVRALGVVTVMFLAVGTGMWSQVTLGWTWAAPTANDTRVAMALMSGALLGLSAIFVLAVILMVWSIVRRGRRQFSEQRGPLLVTATCGVALSIGCWHVAAHWPGAGAPGWDQRSIVPAAFARIGWAGTLWISAYWTHPGALIARSAGMFAWMIVSPLLLATGTAAGVLAVRRVTLSTRALRTLAGLGSAGVVFAALFVAGAAAWILVAGPGPRQMFQAGSVDDVGLALLMSALLAAAHITRRGLVATRRSPGR